MTKEWTSEDHDRLMKEEWNDIKKLRIMVTNGWIAIKRLESEILSLKKKLGLL